MNEKDLKALIKSILEEEAGNVAVVDQDDTTNSSVSVQEDPSEGNDLLHLLPTNVENIEEGEISDISEVNIREQYLVPNPEHPEEYKRLKSNTPARLGLWRAGNRYLTEPNLRFRADHASAQDAVFSDVDEDLINDLGLFETQTLCKDKDEYITRPDLGRRFSDEEIEKIKKHVKPNPKVLVLVGDGLSSAAIDANIRDFLPALKQGLQGHGLEFDTPIFIKYCRVPAMDPIAEATGAEAVCLLIGERPGLATSNSMSAYMAYKPYPGMAESNRTVFSNIHDQGTPAVEAGAFVADTIKRMLDQKTSGVDMK